ncbi:MAG: Protein UmuD [Chlamydiales bacterium]|nr:Protein UmuD [Chlamydiales bacterium]MCH9635016.1 Protein UmuD [Chlamydiales bacterium]MCH9704280.1 translesion error-prone DNA polymerase V autoproteolytic subunit [Chlamydiota bacterium]
MKPIPLIPADLEIPFVEGRLPAGFPSSADDFEQRPLDLHELLVEHPAATFFVRVDGDSMIDAKIESGDILIVDRALTPKSGKVVVALVDGAFTVKQLVQREGGTFLYAANPRFAPIEVTDDEHFLVWGVVTYVIHKA